jgi:hypothetical protein
MLSYDFLSSLKRSDLQALAKKHGLKANASSAVLIDELQVVSTSPPDSPVRTEKPEHATPVSTMTPTVVKISASGSKSTLRSRRKAPVLSPRVSNTSTPNSSENESSPVQDGSTVKKAARTSTSKKIKKSTPHADVYVSGCTPEASTPQVTSTVKKVVKSTRKSLCTSTPEAATPEAVSTTAKKVVKSGKKSSCKKSAKISVAKSPESIISSVHSVSESTETDVPSVRTSLLSEEFALEPALDEPEVKELDKCTDVAEATTEEFVASEEYDMGDMQSAEWAAVLDDSDDQELNESNSPVLQGRANQSANSNTLDAPTAKKAVRMTSSRLSSTPKTKVTTPIPFCHSMESRRLSKSLPTTPNNRHSMRTPLSGRKISNVHDEALVKVLAKSHVHQVTVLDDKRRKSFTKIKKTSPVQVKDVKAPVKEKVELVPRLNKAAQLMMEARQAKMADMELREKQAASAAQPGLRLATKTVNSQSHTSLISRSATSSNDTFRSSSGIVNKRTSSKVAFVPSCATVRPSTSRWTPPEVPAFKAKAMPNFKANVPVVTMNKKAKEAAAAVNNPKPVKGLARLISHCSDIYGSTKTKIDSSNHINSTIHCTESKENAVSQNMASAAVANKLPTKPKEFKLSTSNRSTKDKVVNAKASAVKDSTNSSPFKKTEDAGKVRGQKTPAKNPFESLAV